MSGIMYVAWVMFVEYTRPVSSIEPPRHQRNLGVMFSSAFYSLWYLGVVTVVVGCVRILADAIAGTRSSAK